MSKNSNEEKEWIEMIEGPQGTVRNGDLYPMIEQWESQFSPKSVLDLGCGQGICSQFIKKAKYMGFDHSQTLINRAQKIYSKIGREFVQGELKSLPFADNHFDGILCVSVIHLFETLDSIIKEMFRVLKAGGHFFIIIPNPEAPELWSGFDEILYFHTQDKLDKLIKKESGQIENVEKFRKQNSDYLHMCIQGKKN